MHTVDASSDPSASLMELSASNRRFCPDSALKSDGQEPASQFGNPTMASDQRLPAFEDKAKARAGFPSTDCSTKVPNWKRILDVTFILLTLLLWLPVVALIALWIKIVCPGPILFRQERVGRGGRLFMMLKFRTMNANVETTVHERHFEQLMQTDRPMTKLDAAGDPRIIRGGRLLRATGLDELPQLFNVLRGEMSLVGPRPCTLKEFRRYQPSQQIRVNAAPGLTGYWQVNGKNKTTFTEMINLDIFYTKNMSLRLDLAIILKTLPAILGQVLEGRAARTARSANSSSVGQCSQHCSQ
jgi:lipopolysaccharide/colanic/teichoic acid biosynthesis glycosyltransferase